MHSMHYDVSIYHKPCWASTVKHFFSEFHLYALGMLRVRVLPTAIKFLFVVYPNRSHVIPLHIITYHYICISLCTIHTMTYNFITLHIIAHDTISLHTLKYHYVHTPEHSMAYHYMPCIYKYNIITSMIIPVIYHLPFMQIFLKVPASIREEENDVFVKFTYSQENHNAQQAFYNSSLDFQSDQLIGEEVVIQVRDT